MTAASLPSIAWGVSFRALGGAKECGDLHVVTQHGQTVLVAVIDGLGHGPEAALAAQVAAGTLQQYAGESLILLMQRCHQDLRRTRGAVLSMARLDSNNGMMSWLGVGNVEAVLLRADRLARPPKDSLVLRGGVVGYHIPPLRESSRPLNPGDVLVFATDGVDLGFIADFPLHCDPQEAADAMLARYGKETDDALILVVRYLCADRHD